MRKIKQTPKRPTGKKAKTDLSRSAPQIGQSPQVNNSTLDEVGRTRGTADEDEAPLTGRAKSPERDESYEGSIGSESARSPETSGDQRPFPLSPVNEEEESDREHSDEPHHNRDRETDNDRGRR